MNLKVKESAILSDFLMQALHGISRTSVKQMLRNRQVSVNGHIQTRHDFLLSSGSAVEINKQATRPVSLGNLVEIIHEDDYLIVINKKEGLLSVATREDVPQVTAHSILNHYVQESANPSKTGTHSRLPRIYIVHRLDRETSGLLVFAKDPETKAALQENWEEWVTSRCYVAIAEGKMEREQGTVISWLTDNKAFVTYSSPVDNGGKRAVTHYRVLASDGEFSLVELTLETGRKNQIRVHLKELGHPVAGDTKYGGSKNHRLYLHACKLAFRHPVTGKSMEFTSKAPFGL